MIRRRLRGIIAATITGTERSRLRLQCCDGLRALAVRALVAFAAVVPGASQVAAQASTTHALSPTVDVESLRQTAGPQWRRGQSRHFNVYVEQPADTKTLNATIDSLEVAWANAETLLGQQVPDEPRAAVFVTSSRTRFAGFVTPDLKGVTTKLRNGEYVIVLVHNDSVRVYARHEVMHLVSWRAWGMPGASRVWLVEGLATFADGRCQGTTIDAVGRDLLAARPTVRVQDVVDSFVPMVQKDRATAYVFAGSLVDYVWASRGRAGVRRLWEGRDSLTDVGVLPGMGGELTSAWRAYLAQKAAAKLGLSASTFQRSGCS